MTQSRVRAITLKGFRAYLDEQSIDLKSGKSLAIFSPNGKGKSSLVDAIEFVISRDGTVARLGEKRSATLGGRESLVHHDVEARGIQPFVRIDIVGANGSHSFQRSPVTPEPLPDDLKSQLQSMRVPFIIRGFELRKFVEDERPQERYESVARWFGFTPLLKIQNSLRTARLELKRETDSNATIQNLDQDCSKLTGKQVLQWNEEKVINWYIANYIHPIDANLKFNTFRDAADFRMTLADRAALESKALGVEQHKTLLMKIRSALGVGLPSENKSPIQTVALSLDHVHQAQDNFDQAFAASSTAIFNEVWTAAKKVLDDPNVQIEECPVCETPFSKTTKGSRDAIKIQLDLKLNQLSRLKDAESMLKKAKDAFSSDVTKLRDLASVIATLCAAIGQTENAAMAETLKTALLSENSETISNSLSGAENKLRAVGDGVESYIKANESNKITWSNALSIYENLISLKAKIEQEVWRKKHLAAILGQVTKIAATVDHEIKAYVDGLIGSLSELTNFFYSEIQKGSDRIPKVHLSLPDEKKQIQHALELLIDFADNRKGVPPSGYLSDSQVHTLALSLRIAAITLFNNNFPLIILDDVVTSYDSHFRATIAGLLASHLHNHQLIVLTHDEQFFNQLQEHLAEANWIFRRITKIEPNFGPKYADHRIVDQQIDDEHKDEKSVTNLVRQAEEDWLTEICRGFGTDVKIREINHPYRYSRAELAASLQRFLGSINLKPPAVTEYQNPFLQSLQRGVIENMGSHFTDNPNAASSFGDEKQRWTHFKEFRDHFACPKCGKKRFKRPEGMATPHCRNCETPFAFKTSEALA